jgi:hypothetical protein
MSPTLKATAARTLLVLTAFCAINGCAVSQTLKGVPWGIQYSVNPVYPNGYDVTAVSERGLSFEILKDAWMKKAAQLANGQKYKTSPLTSRVREHAVDNPYVPAMTETRTVTGTVSILGR